jgi:dihydrofolate synthase/folylpolyglutamate synthase
LETSKSALEQYEELTLELNSLIGPILFSKDINLKLERITHLLNLLGNPQNSYPSIHVGGTSGKGSTSTIIASILRQAGYKTGLHTSPHLQILNERFQINNRIIPTTKLLTCYKKIKPAIQEVARENPFGPPSNFEAQVALAFELFKDEQIDIAVVEVGLGGTLDATNVLKANIAVLTNVGLDHTDVLGDTIELIAQDKAGIIKPGQCVISGLTQPSTRKIVEDRCKSKQATLWQLNHHFMIETDEETSFTVKFPDRVYGNLHLGLLGDFQVNNAACAVAAVHAFYQHIPISAIRDGISQANLPGRMEIIQNNPTVVLDGAHNPDKMSAASKAVAKYFPNKERIVVFALKSGKAYPDVLPFVVENTKTLIITTFSTELWHPFDPAILAKAAKRLNPDLDISIEPDPIQAIQLALSIANKEDLIWVTGSLYLVGNVRNYWYPMEVLINQNE